MTTGRDESSDAPSGRVEGTPTAPEQADDGGTGLVVRFANWPDYIDTDPARPHYSPTLAEFTRRTGIRVEYSEPIEGDQQFFSLIGRQLAMGRSPGFDLVVLSDWMAGQLIGLGWAQKLSPDAVPNAANLLPALRASPLADVNSHSLPWQAGFTGIAYNMAATGRPVTAMSELLTSPDLAGRVALTADMRDVMGLIMLGRGTDPLDFTPVEFDLALCELERAVQAGQIRTVTNQYRAALRRGEIAACVAWSGDVLAESLLNPDVHFVIPASGAMLWTDNMVIPAPSPHRVEAERLINYYYEPGVAARVAASQFFVCPVAGAREALPGGRPGFAHDELVFPSAQTLVRGHYFARLTPVRNAVYTEKFNFALGL
jgi:spermidine/putrescine transport system substrate-binding protein